MTYRVIVEPTAEREIRSAVRWKSDNASAAVAARWYNGRDGLDPSNCLFKACWL